MYTDQLSNADREEIKIFIQSKTQIDQFIERISVQNAIDPFDGFTRLENEAESSIESINRHWSNLDDRIQQTQSLQDDLDSIQTCVSALESNDMDKLRSLTKASLKREMSPHDTDLIEIAIQTIVAMDTLLRMLIKRQEFAGILLARLMWETKLRECWNVYLPLKRDLDALVNLNGKWKAVSSNKGTDGKSPKAAFLLAEVELLAGRSKAFIVDQIGSASGSLDDLIEQRRVPELILDEQDRLEDLAETVKSRLVQIARLSMQWRWTKKPDQLYDLLDKLKVKEEGMNSKDDLHEQKIVVNDAIITSDKKDEDIQGSDNIKSEETEIAPQSNDNGDQVLPLTKSEDDRDAFHPNSEDKLNISHTRSRTEEPTTPIVKTEDLDDLIADRTPTVESKNEFLLADERDGGKALDEEIICLDIEDEQDPVDTSSSPYSDKLVSMPFPSSTSSSSTSNGREDRFSDDSSLPSLSSTESLGDVFLVPGTPPSTRGSTIDRKSSETIPKKREPRASRRIVSEGSALRSNDERSTPSRIPIPSTPRSGSRTPTSSARSMGRRTPSTNRNVVTPSDRTKLASTPTSIPKRIRSISTISSSTSHKLPNKYKANPKSKLDVEVGKIVNRMSIPIQITHAANIKRPSSQISNGKRNAGEIYPGMNEKREEWNDESGRYWVGYPDPKLCFCRILRSQRVMVRVGGGWEELSNYIFKHYGHLSNPEEQQSLSKTGTPRHSPNMRKISNTFDGLPWISSKSHVLGGGGGSSEEGGLLTPKDSPENSYIRNHSSNKEESLRLISLPSPYNSTDKLTDELSLSPESMRTLWIRKEKCNQSDQQPQPQQTPQKSFPQDFPFLQTTPTRWPSGGVGGTLQSTQRKKIETPTKRVRAISSVK